MPGAYQPEARASHDRIPGLERIDVSAAGDSYWHLFRSYWEGHRDVLNIEQDIEVTDLALREAEECDCWWGISPYYGPGHGLIQHSLGFVRFRRQLMEMLPDAMEVVGVLRDSSDVPLAHWRRLDARIEGVLRNSERYGEYEPLQPHIHSPVIHHHIYEGLCACQDPKHRYPVDGEGRYHAPSRG